MDYVVDTANAKENEKSIFPLVPKGIYNVMIMQKVDKVTAKGDPMVNVRYEILDNKGYMGLSLFDNIVIPSPESPSFKIMGRTMHFLHVIGQPYQGKFATNSDSWVWRKLKVRVDHAIQQKGKNEGKTFATIVEHLFYDDKIENADDNTPENDEDIPF